MGRDSSDQIKGGELEIPNGYFVHKVDFDAKEPYCIIISDEDVNKQETVYIPKSLAYYLTTHHNGSEEFRELIREKAKNELRKGIKDILKIQ